MKPSAALSFGILISLAGAVYLAIFVNPLTSLSAAFTLATYLFLYTPLKKRSPICTFVGAIPGAMPILIGWSAASATAGIRALALYALLFLWQFPHFMAIAWIYRHDYARAGFIMLPDGEDGERFMSWTTLASSLLLIPISLTLTETTHAGLALTLSGVVLTVIYFHFSLRMVRERSNSAARRLLAASIIYLPIALLVVILGK